MKQILRVSAILPTFLLSANLVLSTDPFDTTALEPAPGVYYGLWNDTGPSVTDVKQVAVLICWWDASSLAVLIASQNWIENLLRYGNGQPMVNASWPSDASVNVTVFTPDTYEPTTHIASVYKKGLTEDHYIGNWWHDAIGQAVLELGTKQSISGVLSNGTWDPKSGSALTGLSLLTGYPTTSNDTINYKNDTETFWNDLAHANTSTPVIFNTVGQEAMGVTVPQLGYDHDYAVINASTFDNGTKSVWARNPWGSTDQFTLDAVFNNTAKIIFLQNWQQLNWPAIYTTTTTTTTT